MARRRPVRARHVVRRLRHGGRRGAEARPARRSVRPAAPPRRLVEPEAGVVCEPGDQVQLSKALRRLIFSASLRAEMGEVAWQIGQKLPHWKAQAALLRENLSR